ncbi:hypothetical protein B0H14DRAFT_3576918 [Mycena olivaceomarginata]|nr:hypothetical protein B0H14DRAFT_3576918 [Mycena olivaceomarginata]
MPHDAAHTTTPKLHTCISGGALHHTIPLVLWNAHCSRTNLPQPHKPSASLDTPPRSKRNIGSNARMCRDGIRYRDAHAHDPPLLPGALYAAIALLVTSILTRHRALPLRAALPPLAAAPFAYYPPHLSANIRAYAGALEDAHLPALAHVHETEKAHGRRCGRAWRSRGDIGEGAG